jgi:hypothetical protein
MVAEEFLHNPQVRQWLDGMEPAWTLSFDGLRALRQEPSGRLWLFGTGAFAALGHTAGRNGDHRRPN